MTLATRLRATSKESLSCRDWSGQAVEINRANLPITVRWDGGQAHPTASASVNIAR